MCRCSSAQQEASQAGTLCSPGSLLRVSLLNPCSRGASVPLESLIWRRTTRAPRQRDGRRGSTQLGAHKRRGAEGRPHGAICALLVRVWAQKAPRLQERMGWISCPVSQSHGGSLRWFWISHRCQRGTTVHTRVQSRWKSVQQQDEKEPETIPNPHLLPPVDPVPGRTKR